MPESKPTLLPDGEVKKVRMRAHMDLTKYLIEVAPHLKESTDDEDWDKAVGGEFTSYTNGWAERAVMEACKRHAAEQSFDAPSCTNPTCRCADRQMPYSTLKCAGCGEEYDTLEEITECYESHPQCEGCKLRNEAVHYYEDAHLCDDCAEELREESKEVHREPHPRHPNYDAIDAALDAFYVDPNDPDDAPGGHYAEDRRARMKGVIAAYQMAGGISVVPTTEQALGRVEITDDLIDRLDRAYEHAPGNTRRDRLGFALEAALDERNCENDSENCEMSRPRCNADGSYWCVTHE